MKRIKSAGVGLALMLAVGCSALDWWKNNTPNGSGTTTTTTTIPALVDDVDVSLLHWRGPSGAAAKVTVSLDGVKRTGGNLYYQAGARTWKLNDSCDSYACLFVSRDGGLSWDGGKFDWARPGEGLRPLNHVVQNGYLDNRYPSETPILPPVDGETWAFVLINLDGTERSEIKKFRW
jgi:hypothetical protein